MQSRETKKEHRGAIDGEATIAMSAAREMLSLFASVGATHFDVTLKDERIDKKISFERRRTLDGLFTSLPSLLTRAAAEQLDIIVRPQSKTPLIQLDDLTPAGVERVRAFAFAVIETSRGSYQAWLSVTDASEDTARKLKATIGADVNASGAVRLCGTKNYKEKYAPDFPTVRLTESSPSRTTTTEELRISELLEETPKTTPPRAPSARRFESRTWPDYSRCLKDAPARNKGEGIDLSRADWQFSLIAADRGFTAQEIADELMRMSEKARQDGIKYAERTAERAAESVARRKAGQ